MMRSIRALSVVALCGMVLTLPRHAFAHAALVQSTPQANAVVHGPVAAIELKYNSRVDGSRSTLVLIAPGGKSLPLSATQIAPGTLTAKANQLTKGSYVLRWQVLSGDGHISRGEIPFVVK